MNDTDNENRAEEAEAVKQQQLREQKAGKGEWKDALASDSESAVSFPSLLILSDQTLLWNLRQLWGCHGFPFGSLADNHGIHRSRPTAASTATARAPSRSCSASRRRRRSASESKPEFHGERHDKVDGKGKEIKA